MVKNWEKQFSEFLKRDNLFTKTQAVLLTSTSDDARERDVIDHSMRNYYGENVKFMNDKTIAYDPGRHELQGIPASDSDTEILADGVLVVGTHGNIHWLFGDLPGGERKAAEKFASNLHALEARYGLKLKTVVLDSCWSAAELKEPVEGVKNVSPARALSAVLGPKYLVLGFNGKAAERHVSHKGERVAPKFKNAIIFCDGEPISGSQHEAPGQGLEHSGETLRVDKTRPHYRKLFNGQKPEMYRTNSFSNLREFKEVT